MRIRFWACSQDFLKICSGVEIWSVVLRLGRKPHWVSSSFGSIYCALTLFKASGTHFSREAKARDTLVVIEFSHVSLFVYGTPICQPFSALPEKPGRSTHESPVQRFKALGGLRVGLHRNLQPTSS